MNFILRKKYIFNNKKARTSSEFDQWLEHLKQHRLYYQFKYTQQFNNSTSINRNMSFLGNNSTNMLNNTIQSQNSTTQNQNQPAM